MARGAGNAYMNRTVTFTDFGDGIDRREGIITEDARKFSELVNFVITPGRKLAMRPPLRLTAGALDIVNSQGAAYLNGSVVTIGKLGTPATHTIAGVTTAYFDAPEGSTDWALIEMIILDKKILAYVRHHFPTSVVAPYRSYLHVFDKTRPTYVEDPAVPASWTPVLPLQPYGAGVRGSYFDYKTRLAAVSQRAAAFTANGDTAHSGVGSPRIWNTRAPSDILTNGRMWYRYLDTTAGIQSFTLPVPYLDLITEGTYAAYVCEYLQADGTWKQFTEATTPAFPNYYSIATTTNRFDPTMPGETRISINIPDATFDGAPVRFRAIAKPTATVLSGLYLTPNQVGMTVVGGTVAGGTLQHEGKSYNIPSMVVPPLTTPLLHVNIVVPVPGAPCSIPTVIDAGVVLYPLNGQQRYWSRTVATVVANSDHNLRVGNVSFAYWDISADTGGGWDYVIITSGGTVPDTTGLAPGDIIQVDTVNGINNFLVTQLVVKKSGYFQYGIRVTPISPLNPPGSYVPWYKVGFTGGFTYAIDGTNAITVGQTQVIGTATKYLSQLTVGRLVEINGERRKVIHIANDLQMEVDVPYSTTLSGLIGLSDPTYQYASEIGDTGNDWYAGVEATITLTEAGKDDAIVLGTSKFDENGGTPLAMATLQNRLLVQFPSIVQAWQVGETVAEFKLLSLMGQGAEGLTRPISVLVDGYAGLPTVNGPRMFSPTGNNKDYVDFLPVGDALRDIPLPDFDRAVWWPRYRCWISAGSSDQGATGARLFVLFVHKGSKVLSWGTFELPDLPPGRPIDTLFTQDNKLVVKSGAHLYYFDPDPDPGTYADVTAPLTARARWLYNTLGIPQKNKKFLRFELIQKGKSAITMHVNPRALVFPDAVSGPVFTGTSVGVSKLMVMAMGPVIGVEISSSDPIGYTLDSIAFDYTLLDR